MDTLHDEDSTNMDDISRELDKNRTDLMIAERMTENAKNRFAEELLSTKGMLTYVNSYSRPKPIKKPWKMRIGQEIRNIIERIKLVFAPNDL